MSDGIRDANRVSVFTLVERLRAPVEGNSFKRLASLHAEAADALDANDREIASLRCEMEATKTRMWEIGKQADALSAKRDAALAAVAAHDRIVTSVLNDLADPDMAVQIQARINTRSRDLPARAQALLAVVDVLGKRHSVTRQMGYENMVGIAFKDGDDAASFCEKLAALDTAPSSQTGRVT